MSSSSVPLSDVLVHSLSTNWHNQRERRQSQCAARRPITIRMLLHRLDARLVHSLPITPRSSQTLSKFRLSSSVKPVVSCASLLKTPTSICIVLFSTDSGSAHARSIVAPAAPVTQRMSFVGRFFRSLGTSKDEKKKKHQRPVVVQGETMLNHSSGRAQEPVPSAVVSTQSVFECESLRNTMLSHLSGRTPVDDWRNETARFAEHAQSEFLGGAAIFPDDRPSTPTVAADAVDGEKACS